MREVVLRITDKKGVWFRMKVETPSNKNKILGGIGKIARIFPYGDELPDLVPDVSWKVSDEGFIKIRSGKARPRFSTNGDLTTRDLLILGELGAKSYDGNDSFGNAVVRIRGPVECKPERRRFYHPTLGYHSYTGKDQVDRHRIAEQNGRLIEQCMY